MSIEHVFAPAQLAVVSESRTASVRESARVAGHAAGWAAGARAAADAAVAAAQRVAQRTEAAEADARARLNDALRTLGAAAGAAASREAGVVEDATATLVALAIDLAEAIVGVELSRDEFSARAALTRALELPATTGPVVVRLNPTDLAHVRAMCERGDHALPAHVTLAEDATLERGDAVSELPTGHLDARLGTAMARLRAALEESVADASRLPDLLGDPTDAGAR
ncbi:FliH/SctL family protein [Sanguibacter sp. A247]|uniref:FliH/SctL family protein n=1 Tax=unclassified Sanguibacter TaxID=2645534 RepID=UPI003FD8410F